MDPHGPTHEADAAHLASFGYRQELRRVLGLFENFAVAFAYLSPVVGIYSLFVLGFGTGGPRYLWLMPVVVLGQLLVALVFAELGSNFPIAGRSSSGRRTSAARTTRGGSAGSTAGRSSSPSPRSRPAWSRTSAPR